MTNIGKSEARNYFLTVHTYLYLLFVSILTDYTMRLIDMRKLEKK